MGKWKTGQTHCNRGHVLTPDNIVITPRLRGKRKCIDRECLACRRESHRRVTSDRNIRSYGITPEHYRSMENARNGLCDICKQPNAHSKHLCIDHDHRCCKARRSCGKCIRGLLCSGCNLGHFGEDPSVLRRAAAYFEKWDKVWEERQRQSIQPVGPPFTFIPTTIPSALPI
jgi:hypothetical protein